MWDHNISEKMSETIAGKIRNYRKRKKEANGGLCLRQTFDGSDLPTQLLGMDIKGDA